MPTTAWKRKGPSHPPFFKPTPLPHLLWSSCKLPPVVCVCLGGGWSVPTKHRRVSENGHIFGRPRTPTNPWTKRHPPEKWQKGGRGFPTENRHPFRNFFRSGKGQQSEVGKGVKGGPPYGKGKGNNGGLFPKHISKINGSCVKVPCHSHSMSAFHHNRSLGSQEHTYLHKREIW